MAAPHLVGHPSGSARDGKIPVAQINGALDFLLQSFNNHDQGTQGALPI